MLTIPTRTPAPDVDWGALVAQIQAGDEAGSEKLYAVFSRGLRYYLARQLGVQDYEDKVHEIFVVVLRAIRNGDLREPERLMGFVRTVARRQVASYIETQVQCRQRETDLDSGAHIVERSDSPEDQVMLRERIEIVRDALEGLAERDRQILVRFYLHEQSQEQICEEMGLTATQFRLRKSRAKAKFGELGQKQVRKPNGSAAVRSAASPLVKRACA